MAKPPTCTKCGRTFSVKPSVAEKFPGWVPSLCPACYRSKGGPPNKRPKSGGNRRPSPAASSPPRPAAAGAPSLFPVTDDAIAELLATGPDRQTPALVRRCDSLDQVTDLRLRQSLEQVLDEHHAGPSDGLFTDGGCSGNPGPGGWGAVRVDGNAVVQISYGREPRTTNNRMELKALLAAYTMIRPEDKATLWSDSQLCVNTVNTWAAGWAKKGWRRKGGAVKNLDLVRPLYELSLTRPDATLAWVKAHDGNRWNEFVDTLATAFLD